MIRRALRAGAATLAISGAACLSAVAQDAVDTASLADLMASACLFDSLDFDAEYTAALATVAEHGLPLMVEQEQLAVYGNPAEVHLVVGRKIDELFCSLRLPASLAPKEVFADFESKMANAITATYPDHISQPDDNPSPHIEGHDWVANFPGKMHFAASIDWGTEDGLQLAVGFRQLYE